MQERKHLGHFLENEIINREKCAHMMADLAPEGQEILEKHQEDFGEILLHVLAGELITESLIDLLKFRTFHTDRITKIECYCQVIETMWKNGDADVVNVVDVTILERLSDEDEVWQRFGSFISDEFKQYINNELLATNLMMGGVKALE